VGRRSVQAGAVAIALLAVAPAAAYGCDYSATLSVDEVAAAGPGGDVDVDGQTVMIVGVAEYEVTASSWALIPVTSARARGAMVRSWGDAPAGDGPVVPSGLVPYLGGYGSSCGAFGPAWAYQPTSTERLRDTLAVWAPHLLVVGAVLVTVLFARFAGRES